MDGCPINLDGACYLGAAGPLPQAGQNSYYFALADRVPCCLAGDVPVHLWAGGSKLAGEIADGDVLVGIDEIGNKAPQTVRGSRNSFQPCLRVASGKDSFVCSMSHELVGKAGAKVIVEMLQEGESHLVNDKMEAVTVTALEPVGCQDVYYWECLPDHNFFAAGMLHHNKIIPPDGEGTPN